MVTKPEKIDSSISATAPDVTVTVRSMVPAGLSRITVWAPSDNSLIVTGVVPFGVPSTSTRAPSGVERTASVPVDRVGAAGALRVAGGGDAEALVTRRRVV